MYRESFLISASAPLPGGSTVGSHGVNRGGADGGRFCVEMMRPLLGPLLSSSGGHFCSEMSESGIPINTKEEDRCGNIAGSRKCSAYQCVY